MVCWTGHHITILRCWTRMEQIQVQVYLVTGWSKPVTVFQIQRFQHWRKECYEFCLKSPKEIWNIRQVSRYINAMPLVGLKHHIMTIWWISTICNSASDIISFMFIWRGQENKVTKNIVVILYTQAISRWIVQQFWYCQVGKCQHKTFWNDSFSKYIYYYVPCFFLCYIYVDIHTVI